MGSKVQSITSNGGILSVIQTSTPDYFAEFGCARRRDVSHFHILRPYDGSWTQEKTISNTRQRKLWEFDADQGVVNTRENITFFWTQFKNLTSFFHLQMNYMQSSSQ